MSGDRQLDLFSGSWRASSADVAVAGARARLDPATLDDAALIRALPHAGLTDAPGLAAETARRRLTAAVPALDRLCRRFTGFGVHAAIAEQVAALEALAAIGGRDAASAVSRVLSDGVVQAPGLPHATAAAVRLRAAVPTATVLGLLRHANPAVRADGCRLARTGPDVVPLLLELLSDLHPEVAATASCALGRIGRNEARPGLIRLLANAPSAEIIEAFAGIADEDGVVVLGRLAANRPDLADAVLAALDEIELPRAAIVADGVRRRLANRPAPP